nr:hypothetical protein [Tanacetum cinerariifolium]
MEKPSTGMERARKTEAEGIYIFNGPIRAHFIGPEEQAARINSLFQDHNPQKFFISLVGDDEDDDYDKEGIISTNTDIFETPPSDAITTSPPALPIKDPEDSLIIGNEELNTIPKKESDEFIKSSVEDLVPIPSDSEDTSGSEIHHDPSILAMSVVSILKGFTDEPPLKENDELFDLEPKNDEWKKILYDAPILMTEDKNFNPEIHDQNFSPTYDCPDFKDTHARGFVHCLLELQYLSYGNSIS